MTEKESPVHAGAKPPTVGYGKAPVVALGVMCGLGIGAFGWGLINEMTKDETSVVAEQSPAEKGVADESRKEGSVTVTLPDRNRDGVPDAFEGKGGGTEDTGGTAREETGKGDEDENGPSEKSRATSEPTTYIIEWGDTLTEISAETGVSIDRLVEENRIRNPNLIYAGSALLIPPKG